MAVIDWRAWIAQQGGSTPPSAVPAGLTGAYPTNQLFPGILPITDQVLGSNSIPTYPNSPVTINAIDPFYVGTYPTGYGWTSQREGTNVAGPFTPRPAIPGLTSP
jgi:hypothetical protein